MSRRGFSYGLILLAMLGLWIMWGNVHPFNRTSTTLGLLFWAVAYPLLFYEYSRDESKRRFFQRPPA